MSLKKIENDFLVAVAMLMLAKIVWLVGDADRFFLIITLLFTTISCVYSICEYENTVVEVVFCACLVIDWLIYVYICICV